MSSLSLQSSGQISIDDVRNLMPLALYSTNQSLRTFASHCGFSTPDSFSEFYGYTITCDAVASSMNFTYDGGTIGTTVTISGGSGTFHSSQNVSWISRTNYSTAIIITCDPNSGGARTGSVWVTHDDNNYVYDMITINQDAAPDPTLSINPFILEWDYLSTIQKYTQVTLDPDSTITVTADAGAPSHWTFSINQSLNRVYFTPTTTGGSIEILAAFIISAGAEYPNRTIQLVHAANECFVEGTLITLPSGEQTKVENLVEEQSVQSALIEGANTNNVDSLLQWVSKDLNYDKLSTKVKSNKSRVVHETIIINNGLIEATAEHIQLIKSSNVWKLIRFKDIKEGDKLYTIDEKLIEITSIEINNKPRTVYKLSLYDPYMYYANNILTHNIKRV